METNDEELLKKWKEQKEKQYKRQREHAAANYDRVALNVPKGQREVIERVAKERGYKSSNAYIWALIEHDIKLYNYTAPGSDVPF